MASPAPPQSQKTQTPKQTFPDLERDIGARLAKLRLSRNITQRHLAREAGVALGTLGRLERGEPTSLDTFLRVAAALELTDGLLLAIPENPISPIQRLDGRGRDRLRARPKRDRGPAPPWAWGPEG